MNTLFGSEEQSRNASLEGSGADASHPRKGVVPVRQMVLTLAGGEYAQQTPLGGDGTLFARVPLGCHSGPFLSLDRARQML